MHNTNVCGGQKVTRYLQKKWEEKENAEQMLTKLFPLGFASVSMKLECNASVISAARPPLGAEEFGFVRIMFSVQDDGDFDQNFNRLVHLSQIMPVNTRLCF